VSQGIGDRLVHPIDIVFGTLNESGGTASANPVGDVVMGRNIFGGDTAAVKGTIDTRGGARSSTSPASADTPHVLLTSIAPENVSRIAKTPPDPRGDAHEQLVKIRQGETFEDVLQAHGADKDAIPSILQAFGLKHGESPVPEGQKIILQFTDATGRENKPAPIGRISVYCG
jgi:hypothetical protein